MEVGTYILERRELVVDRLVSDGEGRGIWLVKKVLCGNYNRFDKRLIPLWKLLGLLRNQAGSSDVTKFQHQHDDTLETNDPPTVGRIAPYETLKVVRHHLRVDLGLPHPP